MAISSSPNARVLQGCCSRYALVEERRSSQLSGFFVPPADDAGHPQPADYVGLLPEASDSTPAAKLWQDGNVDAFFHLVP